MILAIVLAQCFVLEDPTPGWKQVTLPAEAPQLAAPEGYEQFRSGDPLVMTHDLESIFRNTWKSSPGKHEFEFGLAPGARTLTVQFTQPLYGAKVDVVLEGRRGRMAVMNEKRIEGDRLELGIALPEATTARVSVHSHLRGAPTLSFAEVESVSRPRAIDLPAQFTLGRSLFVLKGSGPLTLCQRPAQQLRINARSLLEPTVTSALITRTKS
ncbi:MAG: hypothetical protein JNM69_12305 [Archangium sp.]|nr:hypothetical protein [Archangium sp.]